MKLQEIRRKRNVEQLDLATRVGTNAPMMSAFEHYKCLPIPSMLNAIAKELKCDITDIYEPDEIYIKTEVATKAKRIASDNPLIYKLTVELPNEARKILTQDNLEKLGYKSIRDFIQTCVDRFEKKLVKKQEKSHQAPKLLNGNENGNIPNISHH